MKHLIHTLLSSAGSTADILQQGAARYWVWVSLPWTGSLGFTLALFLPLDQVLLTIFLNLLHQLLLQTHSAVDVDSEGSGSKLGCDVDVAFPVSLVHSAHVQTSSSSDPGDGGQSRLSLSEHDAVVAEHGYHRVVHLLHGTDADAGVLSLTEQM